MKNKTLANFMIATMASVILVVIFEDSMKVSTQENLYILLGLSYYVFGIWSVIRLKKCEDKK